MAEILVNLESDNWSVISDALGVAARLPKAVRREPILHLLDLWQQADIKWIHPDQAADALLAITDAEGGAQVLEGALTKVSLILLDDRHNSPDLEEVMSSITGRLSPEHLEPLLTSIETVLSMPSIRSRTFRYLGGALRDARRDSSDAFDALIALWVQILDERSTQELSSDLVLGRAVRLLAAEPSLLRRMGLVALGAALGTEAQGYGSRQVLHEWLDVFGAEWFEDYGVTTDLLDLLSVHQGALTVEASAKLLELGLSWANSEDQRDQWRAWYLLGALRPSLGPRERVILEGLEATRGDSSGRIDSGWVESGWIGEQSAIPPDELRQMSPQEIVSATAYVPSGDEDYALSRGATVSGFAQALKAEFLKRPQELIPVADDIASLARDTQVINQLAWAVRKAFDVEDPGDDQSRDHVIRFCSALRDRIQHESGGRPREIIPLEMALGNLLDKTLALAR